MAILDDILKLVMSAHVGIGCTVQNVYWLRVADLGGIDDADIPDDMDEYIGLAYDEITAILPDNLIFDEFHVTNVTADVDLGIHPITSIDHGTGGSTFLPTGVAALGRMRTDTPGHEGRKFVGPIDGAFQTDGTFIGDLLTVMAAYMLQAFTEFESTGVNTYEPVIVDRKTDEARPITSLVVSNNPAYQRRRRVGRGV